MQFRVSTSPSGIEQLLNGNPDKINPDLPLDEQTELLPYDKNGSSLEIAFEWVN